MSILKKSVLKEDYRKILLSDYKLRTLISLDIDCHEETIKRRAIANSPRLTTSGFLNSFCKHTGIVYSDALIEQVGITQSHEITQ